MKIDISVPEMGESISTAYLSSWLFEDGSNVTEGAELCELESDKATMAVPAPAEGILKILIPRDTEVTPGTVIGSITPAEALDSKPGHQSPAVRRMAAETGVDPDTISGSGKDGRVTKADMCAHVEETIPEENSLSAPAPPPAPDVPAPAVQSTEAKTGTEYTREPMSRIRRSIAANLVASKRESAHLTTFNEVNLAPVMEIRKSLGEEFLASKKVKLGFMSFFVKAACRALKDFPRVNSSIDGTDMILYKTCNVGIAVSTDRGLVVPVLKQAEAMGFADIERAIAGFGNKAREKKLTLDDMSGGTFTITNGGIFGSLLSTPIPTPPQTAVLGMHTIQKRPVAENDQVVIRPMMYLALTYDHRIIDGKEAVGFLTSIKRQLENPQRLLLEL